jgi:hypothetical protein
MQEWLEDKSLNILEWPSQSPDLNPIEHLWRDLKITVQRRSTAKLAELERICREKWEKLPKCRFSKLVASYPRRREAGLLPKVLQFFYCNKFDLKNLRTCFCFVIMGYCVKIEGGKRFNEFKNKAVTL